MANPKPLPEEKIRALESEVNSCVPLLHADKFEEVLEVVENIIPTLQQEFKKFEWSDPIDAYAYAKQLPPEGQKYIMEMKGVWKIEDLKGRFVPHPYFMVIQNMYHAALSNKSAALGRLKKYDEAIEVLKNAIEINQRTPEAWTNLAVLYIENDNPQQAAKCFRKAIQYKPEEERFWSNIGKYYEVRKRNEELAIVEKTTSLLGKSTREVLYNFLDLCLFGGDTEIAEEVITLLRQEKEGDPDVLLRYARIKAMQNNYESAIDILNQALKKDKKRADIHGELGRVFALAGKQKDALKALEKSMKINPDPQYKYLKEMIKEKKDSTCHINMISAVGDRQFRVHIGMKIPLGMTLFELLYNISEQGLGGTTSPYGFETTFVQIFDGEDKDFRFAADHISFPAPTGISGREPGEFTISYSETFSSIPYINTGYRPTNSLMTIPLEYNAIDIHHPDVPFADIIMMPFIPRLVQAHDIRFEEKKKELFG